MKKKSNLKLITILISIILILTISAVTIFNGSNKIESYDGATSGASQGVDTSSVWIAQGFYVSQIATLKGITLRLYSTDNSSLANITVGIWNATDSGTDSTPIVLVDKTKPESVNTTVTHNLLSNSTTFKEINITLPSITLYPNRNYSWGIHLGENVSSVQVEQTTLIAYSRGNRGKSTDNAVTFSTPGASDAWFQVWGNPVNLNNNSVILISPVDGFSSTSNSFNFNGTSTAFFQANLTNSTLQIWNSSNALINSTFKLVSGIVLNESYINVNLSQIDSYKWNMLFCAKNISSTGTICSYAPSNYTFSYGILNISSVFNPSPYETSLEFFEENISVINGYNITSADLIFNNTAYSGTINYIAGNNYSLRRSLDIPLLNATVPISWNVTLNNSINLVIGSHNQNIGAINLSLCGSAPQNVVVANYTFKDEVSLAFINATISSVVTNYTLGNGNINKTFTYTSGSDIPSYAFCLTPSSRNVTISTSFRYSATNYPQRSYATGNLIWNSSNPYLQTLYLLSSADGLFVTFQVVNPASQTIGGVSVNATSGGLLISSGTTDTAGLVTFWVNPNNEHTFTFSKIGLDDVVYTTFPTQSSYTITMGGSTSLPNNTIQGVNYEIQPNQSYLYNNTAYNFVFNLTSNYWTVSQYGFNLRLSNGTVITGGSTGVVGTPITKNYNVNNQSIVYMDYYWVINGNYTNGSRYWVVQNTDNTGWSIANLFTDLTVYINSGLFGLDDFGRYLIIFLVIFMISGFVSYKYGATSPIAVTTVIFSIIFFFDVVANLIPVIRGIPYLLTYISALALVLSIFREVKQ